MMKFEQRYRKNRPRLEKKQIKEGEITMAEEVIKIDLNSQYREKDNAWQKCVGSGHAFLAHRTDWCRYVKFLHDELGIQYVRFHGIFDDDMLTVQSLADFIPLPGADKIKEYSFRQIGNVYDNVLSTGMKPFVELSFMPSKLASGKRFGLHYRNNITPPRDYNEWADYISSFIRFLINRYGKDEVETWYFEVWNEPDLSVFFTKKQKDYFKLYKYTVKAIKSVDEKIQVGGPSTSAGKWLKDFIDFTESENLPCDFISTHQYPGDGFGNTFHISDVFTRYLKIIKQAAAKGKDVSETITNLFFRPEDTGLAPRGIMTQAVKRSRNIVGNRPLFYTEWNCLSVFGAPAQDEKYSAAFAMKTLMDMNHETDCFSFWCCNDLFEEIMFVNKPFHGGFGLLTNLGIPKPVFWALKLIADSYSKRLDLSGNTDEEVEYAVFNDGDKYQVFIYAQTMDYRERKNYSLDIELNRVFQSGQIIRIDDNHCNPKEIWKSMGSPMDPTKQQEETIKELSKPVKEELSLSQKENGTGIHLNLSSNDVIVLYLE